MRIIGLLHMGFKASLVMICILILFITLLSLLLPSGKIIFIIIIIYPPLLLRMVFFRYGDISPTTKYERLIVILLTLLSCANYAYSINYIGELLGSLNNKKVQY